MYDSKKDTLIHIHNIKKVMKKFIEKFYDRTQNHDKSKLESPEKETYDTYIPLLKETQYGTKEYYEIRDKMEKEGLKHHYEVNRHHPEHFPNGINDMTLIDLVEMFSDWLAASRVSDTNFETGLLNNKKRFKMSDQLYQIFKNTYDEEFSNENGK